MGPFDWAFEAVLAYEKPKAKSPTKGVVFELYFFRSSCFFVVLFLKHLRPCFGFLPFYFWK
jgi:hypothetical protein